MLDSLDINYSLISAVRKGDLKRVSELIHSFGLSYSQAWSGGYVLLREAVQNGHTEIAKLLLTNGSKVNSKTKNRSDTPLRLAVIKGNREIVKMLLNRGANVNARNACGFTALHDAVRKRKMEITQLLLNRGVNVDAVDDDGITPLHLAVMKGNRKIVKMLLNKGANVNARNVRGFTVLHVAVQKRRMEITQLLLKHGANVNAVDDDGITPLHIAAKKGYVQIAKDLLNHGAYTHSVCTLKQREGYTPLHFASEQGSQEAVKLFLSRGADVNANAKDNSMPLHVATKAQYEIVVKLLLKHGAKVDAQDKDGKTTLYLAVENGYLMIVKVILKYCPDINNQSNRSSFNTAVHGYKKEHKKIIETLLQHGFTVNPEDVNNPELLHTAVGKGYLKIVENLLKCGANVNMLHCSIFKIGFTPLHTAIKNEQKEVAKLLINYGANVNVKDESEKTPIFYAIENVDAKVTKLLLTNGAGIKDSPELLSIAVEKKCKEIVEILLQHDADINASDECGRTALYFTTQCEDEEPNIHVNGEIATLLLSKGANVNAKTKNGVTTLHAAIRNECTKVVEALLEYNADVNYIVKHDITLLHLSVRKGNELISEMLLNKGADVNATQKDRITALHIAAKTGHSKIVKILLKFGAEVDFRDEYGRTALHIASKQRHVQVVNALLKYGSDINIISKDNHTPLEYSIDPHLFHNTRDPGEQVSAILKQYIVKLKTAGLYVNERNLMLTNFDEISGNEISNFQSKCEAEIEIMKSEKIDNSNTSFHDILTKSISKLAIYARNKNIVQALKSDDYKTKFPIYASMINSQFRKGIEKNELLEQGNMFFHSLCKSLLGLPTYCTDKILSYLNDEDLRILIDACKPLVTPNTYISDVEHALVVKGSQSHALFNRAPQYISWPSGDEAQLTMGKFEENSGFVRTIGAIDGTYIKIEAPKENSKDYINRKGHHSIQLQLVCNHKAMITHCYVGHPGSVHDQRVFRQLEVAEYLNDDSKFPFDNHVVGDSVYELY